MNLCRMVVWVFAVLWILALALLAIGTYGWFGQEKDPLSAIFVVMLGLPWVRFIDGGDGGAPFLAALAPGVNLLILSLLCRLFRRT